MRNELKTPIKATRSGYSAVRSIIDVLSSSFQAEIAIPENSPTNFDRACPVVERARSEIIIVPDALTIGYLFSKQG